MAYAARPSHALQEIASLLRGSAESREHSKSLSTLETADSLGVHDAYLGVTTAARGANVGLGVGLGVGDGVGLGVGLGVGDGVGLGVGEGVGDGVGVGVTGTGT